MRRDEMVGKVKAHVQAETPPPREPVWTTTACPHCGGEVDGIRVLEQGSHGLSDPTAARAALAALRATLRSVLGNDTPWPLADVLDRAADAVTHMLHDHGCDRHGWELDAGGIPRLKHYAEAARAALSGEG